MATTVSMITRIKTMGEYYDKANVIIEEHYSDPKRGFGSDIQENVKIMDRNIHENLELSAEAIRLQKLFLDRTMDFEEAKRRYQEFLDRISK